MNYKWFFKRVWRIVTSPAKTWDAIATEDKDRNFFSDYFYPLIGFCGLALFGVHFFDQWMAETGTPVSLMVQNALMDSAEVFIAFLGGYFFAIALIRKTSEKILDIDTNGSWLPLLTGYSMTIPILLQTLAEIFSSFLLLKWIFLFYTLYIVWEGVKRITTVKEEARLSFSILTAVVLTVIPLAISLLFRIFTNALN